VSPLSVPFGPVESDCSGPPEVDPSPPGEPPVAPEESPAGDVGPSLLDGAPDEPPPAAAELPSVVEFAAWPPLPPPAPLLPTTLALPVLPAVLRFGGWHHFSQLLGLRLPGGVSGVGWLMLVGWRELARKERHGETCAAFF